MRVPVIVRPLLAASALLVLAHSAVAQEVGRAGAVNPASTGTPPARPTRVLELGASVVHRERIATGSGGTVQLVFLDKTTMSVGPNSSVVIDEFVYDPQAGTGRLTASMAKGVLRFVGGNTSHSGGAEIKTPAATLGIRGGVATVEIIPCGAVASPECGTRVTNHFGILSITSAQGTEVIRRPGFVVTIPNAATSPTAPRRVTQAELNRTNASLTSKPGQTGGGRAGERAVERANVAGPVIAQIGASVASVQSQTQARNADTATILGLGISPTDATTPTQIRQITATTLTQQVTGQITQQAVTGGNETNPIVPVLPASPQAFALAYSSVQSPQLLVPGATYNSPILGYADGGTVASGQPNTNARTLQAGLGISGVGAAQSSTLYVVVGNSFVGPNGVAVSGGGLTGTRRASATGLIDRVSGGTVASGANVALDAGYAPTRITNATAGTVSDTGVVVPQNGQAVQYPGRATQPINYQISSERIATPAGLGSNRPAIDSVPLPYFGGFAAGLVTTTNNATGATGATNILTGLFDLTFGQTSQFGTTLSVNASNADGNGLSYALLDYGKPVSNFFSRPEVQDRRGTYVDYNTFGAREAQLPGGGFSSEVNGAAVQEHRGVFVTADTVNAKSFFPNTTFCACEYTRWGFWSSETTRAGANGQSVTDLVHLGTWVFGDQTRSLEMPTTGTATYAGHAIASIKNGSAEYVAAGNFQNVVNFGQGTGAASVTGLDGRNYAGTLRTSGPTISGTLNSSVAGSAMAMNGLFYRGLSGPAGEMGGTVTISGTPGYTGAGIFAGAAPAPR